MSDHERKVRENIRGQTRLTGLPSFLALPIEPKCWGRIACNSVYCNDDAGMHRD